MAGLNLVSTNCSTYGNGGKLTTDAFGNVICAADQGGSGSTVGGADTQVQFNSGGSFAGSASFTFSSSTGKLTVPNASTTDLSVSGNSILGSATSTSLFSTIADFTTAIANTFNASVANIVGFTATNATTTSLYITGTKGALLKTDANGQVAAAVAGIDYQAPITTGNLTVGSKSFCLRRYGCRHRLGGFDNSRLQCRRRCHERHECHRLDRRERSHPRLDRNAWRRERRHGHRLTDSRRNPARHYAGTGYQQLATSSLGLLTTNVTEGSNLYFTNARAQALSPSPVRSPTQAA